MYPSLHSFVDRSGDPGRKNYRNISIVETMDNKNKVKHNQNSDTKTGNRVPHQNHPLRTVSITGGGLNQFYGPTSPSITDVVQTFSLLFGSHNDPLTRQ